MTEFNSKMNYLKDYSGDVITAFDSEGTIFNIGDSCSYSCGIIRNGIIRSFDVEFEYRGELQNLQETGHQTYVIMWGGDRVHIDKLMLHERKKPNILLLLNSKI